MLDEILAQTYFGSKRELNGAPRVNTIVGHTRKIKLHVDHGSKLALSRGEFKIE
jgi:hypothetical protein